MEDGKTEALDKFIWQTAVDEPGMTQTQKKPNLGGRLLKTGGEMTKQPNHVCLCVWTSVLGVPTTEGANRWWLQQSV